MSKFPRYVFSEEAKKNLANFLDVARKNPLPSNDKTWEKILPQNTDLIGELEAIIANNKSVIDLTANAHTDELEDVSNDDISVIVDDVNEKLSITVIQSIKESLKENVDVLNDIMNYSNEDINEIFSTLATELSSEQICNIGTGILNDFNENAHIINQYLKCLLFPKIFDKCTQQLLLIFSSYIEHFPTNTYEALSFCLNEATNYPHSLICSLKDLKLEHKQQLIRFFIINNKQLNQSHFPIIEALLHPDIEISTLKCLIASLSSSSSNFTGDKEFGKLLHNILKCSKKHIIHFKQQLSVIVDHHQTIWKSSLQKEIEDSLQNSSMLTQSLRY